MPVYVYRITSGPNEGEMFEVVQPMSEDALTEHPESGDPVERVIQPPMIGGKHSSAREKSMLSDNNLDRMGFTKYVKTGDGSYEKTAGKGPGSLSAD
ncbi:MAG: hypothetical protein RLN60_05305 [Phycisphaerales bacterium]